MCLSRLLRLLWAGTVSQAAFVSDDLDGSDECWSGFRYSAGFTSVEICLRFFPP